VCPFHGTEKTSIDPCHRPGATERSGAAATRAQQIGGASQTKSIAACQLSGRLAAFLRVVRKNPLNGIDKGRQRKRLKDERTGAINQFVYARAVARHQHDRRAKSISLGDQLWVKSTGKRAIEQHKLDIIVPQMRQRLDRRPNEGRTIGVVEGRRVTSETRGSSSTTRICSFSVMT